MKESLERFLERELAFLSSRRDPLARYFAQHYPAEAGVAAAFAERYPEPAGQLELEPKQLTDPHAERLIQAFALLAGRIHHKIHDEFPDLTEALLQVMYPHLLRPVPSMSVAQFSAGRWDKSNSIHVAAGSTLASRAVGHPPVRCQWRTAYPVDVWPVTVAHAGMQPAMLVRGIELPPRTSIVLQLRLQCVSPFQFKELRLDRLRFYLDGPMPTMSTLYELLFNHATRIWFRDPKRPEPVPLAFKPDECLGHAGLESDEALIPFPVESFAGYRLLTELLAFPQKFLFFDLKNIQPACRAGTGETLEVLVSFDRAADELLNALTAQMFRLSCTPIINLFEKIADPIDLNHIRHEYRVVPDRARPHAAEVYSVDSVSTLDPDRAHLLDYVPFYTFCLGEDRDNRRAFWYDSRRPSTIRGDRGTEVHLVLVDQDFNPRRPAEESVNVHITCSNRDLPAKLLRGGGDLELREQGGGFAGTIKLLHAPTTVRRPGLRWGTLWRFLGQSALNHIPLSDPVHGLSALQESLFLCAGEGEGGPRHLATALRLMIEGVTALESKKVVRPVREGLRVGRCQGMEVTIELDRTKYVGVGAFLFACVLERFFGLHCSVNSFCQLAVRTKQGKGYLKRWPPRSVDQVLK